MSRRETALWLAVVVACLAAVVYTSLYRIEQQSRELATLRSERDFWRSEAARALASPPPNP